MKAIIKLIVLLVIGIVFSSCSSKLLTSQSYTTFKQIDVGGGSEDFLLDTIEGNRLLISCDERREKNKQGSIWEYNFNNKVAKPLPFETELSFNFHPHGICLVKTPEKTYLFVINHESKDNNEIDRFIVKNDKLALDRRFTNLIGTPNDVFAVSANEFYYSDYKFFGGNIVQYNGEYNKIVKHLNYANGIYIENNTLFFSTTLKGHLYKVDLNTKKKQKLAKIKGADNIMEYSSNELLITSHPRFVKFVKHAINSTKISPSVVYKVSKNSKQKELIFYDTGSKISATSTAFVHNERLYLGQVFEHFILEVEK